MLVARRGVTRVTVSGAGYWPGHGRWWLGHGHAPRRWITVSVIPKISKSEFLRIREEVLAAHPANTLRFAWPDLPQSTYTGEDSIVRAVERGEPLFEKEMELCVIVSASNEATLQMSEYEYQQFLLDKIALWRKTGAGSVSALVVRGSQRPSRAEDEQTQRQVDTRYLQACTMLKDAGIALWLVADLYGESKQVLPALDFKLSLKPECLVVQPIKHWAGVTCETRASLAEHFQRLGGWLQLVQLEETAALIPNQWRMPGGPRVDKHGRDLYAYDPELPGLIASLGQKEVEQLNVGVARWVLGPFLKNNKPNDAWWTRVGMGVDVAFAKRLAIMDTMAPVFEADLADPVLKKQVLAYLERSRRGFTDDELRRWLQEEKLFA